MKKILLFSLLAAAAVLCAQEFRSGKVLSAEASAKDPGTSGLKVPSGRIWAQLIVRLTPGRKLSIYDYVLVDENGTSYPCVGVAENDDVCTANSWNVDLPAPKALYRMLFRIPDFDGSAAYQLKMVLRDSRIPPAKIRILKKNSYTQASALIRKEAKTDRNAR